MAQVLQLRRGTTAQNDVFTGAVAEVSVDTDRESLRVHDGSTMGGKEIADLQTAVPLLPAASSVSGSDTVPVIQSGVARKATKTQILNGIVDANIDAAANISGTKIANDAVTTAKIANDAVTTAKIANDAVTAAKIDNNAVTAAKIASGAVTEAKIDNNAVTAAKIASGAVTGAKIANDAVTTAKINNLAVTSAKLAYDDGPMSGFRNRLINGDFRVAQRGTLFSTLEPLNSTGTPQNNDDAYVLDRWYILSDTDRIINVTQESSSLPTGSIRAMGLTVNTGGRKFGIAQIIENLNCADLAGNTVTLSFKARVSATTKLDNIKAAIVAWSGTADVVTSDIVQTWGAEGTNPTLIANATYENTPANLNVTTSWQTFSITAPIDTANTSNVIVFIWSDVTDTTLGESVYLTDVQLEKGSTATPFEQRSFQTELAICQRYAFNIRGINAYSMVGYARSTTVASLFIPFPVQMRSAPLSLLSGNVTAFSLYHGAAPTETSTTGIAYRAASTRNACVDVTVASGLTANAPLFGGLNASYASIFWSAEL